MSKWLVGSSKIKRFACFNNISVSTTRPFSPPESKEISLKTSSPLKLNKARLLRISVLVILGKLSLISLKIVLSIASVLCS